MRGRYPQVVPVASPAAGTDWTQNVGGDDSWQLVAVSAIFTADANVANRRLSLQFSDGTTVFGRAPLPAVITAGLAIRCSWFSDYGAGIDGVAQSVMSAPIGIDYLPPGFRIATVTNGIQAGDTWTEIALYLRQIPSRDPGASRALEDLLAIVGTADAETYLHVPRIGE